MTSHPLEGHLEEGPPPEGNPDQAIPEQGNPEKGNPEKGNPTLANPENVDSPQNGGRPEEASADRSRQDEHDDRWASNRAHLDVGPVPKGASASRVQGRRLTGPQQGFGKMWQKTFKVAIPGKTPQQVISTWKAEYGRFWPPNTRFYAPVTGIKPGEIGLIKSTQGGIPLSTGVLVLYSDDVSFSYMTPEGHPFAGFINFSAHDEGGTTMAQAQLLIRSNDPMYEAGMMLFGSRAEDRMWQHTLAALADYLGSSAPVETKIVCVDQKRQWKNFKNIRYNGLLPRARRRQKAAR